MLKDPHRSLPDALRQRLRDIPRHEVLCRDVDRLYRAARARAFGVDSEATARDPDAGRHLAECPRCRELYATLADAFNPRPLPLPRRLARSLRQVARQPQRLLPIWIADTRYAAAACYLLAALTLSLAGDASALLRDTTRAASTRTQAWVDEGEARGIEVWGAATAVLGTGAGDGWDRLVSYGASSQRFLAEIFTTFETETRELISGRERPVEGDQDGRSGNDDE